MPRRSKKSLAASRRHAHKNIPVHTNGCSNSKVPYVIRGNFHQGDLQLFSAESAGRQCSCNALIMLCIVENVIDTLTPYHLDQVLQIGDKLYKTRSHELEAANELHPGKLLDQTQMPTELTIDECFYTIVYKQENFRHGRLDNDPLQNELNTWLQYAFTVANTNILVLDGYMMAVYKHNTTGQFLFFDSHSRDENGLVAAEGMSIALIFGDFTSLLNYLIQLIDSLRAKYFGVQPIEVRSSVKLTGMKQSSKKTVSETVLISGSSNQPEHFMNPEDIPGCSTWNDDGSIPSTETHSPYTKWFNSLSKEQRKERLLYKRANSRGAYAIPQNRARKQEVSRKRSRRDYVVPEKRARKQESSQVIMQYQKKEPKSTP